MNIKNGISTLTGLILWILAAVLAICLLAAFINPAAIPFTGLLTLATPIVIILNVFALIYALIRGKKVGWITLIVLLLSIPQIGNLWGFSIPGMGDDDTDLKIMTFNVRNFDLYNWSHNDRSQELIFDQLQKEAPDVICFQEFYSQPGGSWDNITKIRNLLQLEHYYFSRELVQSEGQQWGLATFSRYPITNYAEFMQMTKPNGYGNKPFKGIYTDLVVDEDTVRVFNIHLASIYLGMEDYTTIENLKKLKDQQDDLARSRSILGKLMRAYRKRGKQVSELVRFEGKTNSPYPVVLCGDLNDVPTSFAYHKLSKGMTDAFLSSGWGTGATYNGVLPGLRIDQVFLDESITVTEARVVNLKVSDHKPLVVGIKLP